DLLMNLPNLKELFIPINKHGSNADNVKIINDTFASDKLILYFPAGLVSRKIKGEIVDLPWKKTFITKARNFKRDVVPVYMDGRISNRFYRISNSRKKIGLKANIEMLFLVDEQYRQQNKNLPIVIGDTIPYTTFDRTHNDVYWASWVQEKVYELRNQIKK
ncbi:glycerol acyltransferase, partial [Bacteroidota bacterium]